MANHKRKDPLAWGIVLIIIGLTFLLHNLDFAVWNFFARLWPLILIAWGGWKLYFGLKEDKETSAKS